MSTGCDGEMFNDMARCFVSRRNRTNNFKSIVVPHTRDISKHIIQGHSTQYNLASDPVGKMVVRNRALIHQYRG